MKLDGHALTITWNKVHGPESASTGLCRCGWEESASSQAVVFQEYQDHLTKADELDRRMLTHATNTDLATWLHNEPAVIRRPIGSYAAKALAEIERRLLANAEMIKDLTTVPEADQVHDPYDDFDK